MTRPTAVSVRSPRRWRTTRTARTAAPTATPIRGRVGAPRPPPLRPGRGPRQSPPPRPAAAGRQRGREPGRIVTCPRPGRTPVVAAAARPAPSRPGAHRRRQRLGSRARRRQRSAATAEITRARFTRRCGDQVRVTSKVPSLPRRRGRRDRPSSRWRTRRSAAPAPGSCPRVVRLPAFVELSPSVSQNGPVAPVTRRWKVVAVWLSTADGRRRAGNGRGQRGPGRLRTRHHYRRRSRARAGRCRIR